MHEQTGSGLSMLLTLDLPTTFVWNGSILQSGHCNYAWERSTELPTSPRCRSAANPPTNPLKQRWPIRGQERGGLPRNLDPVKNRLSTCEEGHLACGGGKGISSFLSGCYFLFGCSYLKKRWILFWSWRWENVTRQPVNLIWQDQSGGKCHSTALWPVGGKRRQVRVFYSTVPAALVTQALTRVCRWENTRMWSQALREHVWGASEEGQGSHSKLVKLLQDMSKLILKWKHNIYIFFLMSHLFNEEMLHWD